MQDGGTQRLRIPHDLENLCSIEENREKERKLVKFKTKGVFPIEKKQ